MPPFADGPPPLVFPAPAIIRPADAELLRYGGDPVAAMLPGMVPVIAGGAPPVLTFIDVGTTTSIGNPTTSFGNFTAPTDGLMIVVATKRSDTTRNMDAISIGGSAGAIHVHRVNGVSTAAIASRAVSAGSNAVSFTLSGSPGSNQSAAVTVWLLTNYLSATPFDSNSVAGSGTSDSVAFNIAAGGIAVYGWVQGTSGSFSSFTGWSSATARQNSAVGTRFHASAEKTSAAAITPHTETASWSGSNDQNSLVGASWR